MNYQKIEVLVGILDVIFEFRVKNPYTGLGLKIAHSMKLNIKPSEEPTQMKSIASKILSLITFFQLRLSIYILKSAFYLNLTVSGELSEN